MSRVIGDSRGPAESADCRPSRRHWSAHRHRGSKDGVVCRVNIYTGCSSAEPGRPARTLDVDDPRILHVVASFIDTINTHGLPTCTLTDIQSV